MFSLKGKARSARSTLADEYAKVNANPIIKNIIQMLVMIVDLLIMFVLIWNMFAWFVPRGSWINFVNGDSMFPTMHDGQLIFADMSEIKRGDIISAYAPIANADPNSENNQMVVIKRVVGVPGDRIIIDQDGIHVNGNVLTEYYLTPEAARATYVENKCNSVMLDKDEYFLLGDNRAVSYDSRSFGVVNKADILYKQSDKPTNNFYLKSLFVLLIFALDVFLYMLIEYILTGCAYWLLFKRKNKNNADNEQNVPITTTETVILKGDMKNNGNSSRF